MREQVDTFMKTCGNMKSVDSIHVNLVEYCKLQNNPLEILETDDATYIKSYSSKEEIDSFEDVEDTAE